MAAQSHLNVLGGPGPQPNGVPMGRVSGVGTVVLCTSSGFLAYFFMPNPDIRILSYSGQCKLACYKKPKAAAAIYAFLWVLTNGFTLTWSWFCYGNSDSLSATVSVVAPDIWSWTNNKRHPLSWQCSKKWNTSFAANSNYEYFYSYASSFF